MHYVETSAKTNEGVEVCMKDIFEQILTIKLDKLEKEALSGQVVKKKQSFSLKANRHSEIGTQQQKAAVAKKKGCC